MKRFRTIFSLILLLIAFFACNDIQETEYAAKKAEVTHVYEGFLAHKPLPDSQKMDSLVGYFEENGIKEDKMLCSYLKGASYYQDGCRKAAYQELRQAYDAALMPLSERSKDVMRGILSHLQYLCLADYNTEEAMRWWKVADSLKVYKEDNLYVQHYEYAMLMYYSQKQNDCETFLQKSIQNMLCYPEWDENKSGCLSNIAYFYAVSGNEEGFKSVCSLLQQRPFYGKNSQVDYYKGLFFMKSGRRDSAEVCFRRALQSPEHAYPAALQLGIAARNRHEDDTVFYYFQKCVTLTDSIIEAQGKSYTRDLEALYRNKEHEQKIAEQRVTILTGALVCIVVLLLALGSFMIAFFYRRRFKQTHEELGFEQSKREELEIHLQEIMDKLQAKKTPNEDEEAKIAMAELLHMLECMADAGKSASTVVLAQLTTLIVSIHPDVCESMKREYPRIKSTDIVICSLVKYGFKQAQIAKLLDRESSEIYHFILRISKGLTGEPIGRMADFLAMLDERFFVDAEE